MWHMHNVLIYISLGHLPLRTEEPCAGSTRHWWLQDKKMSGDHKVTVVFYGRSPAGGLLLFNHWIMGETGDGNDLDWWDDAVQVCENCGTVHGGAGVHLVLWWLGPVHCAGLDVSELHNNLLLFVYFSEHSWERGAVRCPGGKPTLCHIAYNRIPLHVEYLPSK